MFSLFGKAELLDKLAHLNDRPSLYVRFCRLHQYWIVTKRRQAESASRILFITVLANFINIAICGTYSSFSKFCGRTSDGDGNAATFTCALLASSFLAVSTQEQEQENNYSKYALGKRLHNTTF
ncbi:hypothetical protein T11_13111 [Trichinella zimbabwensis]|uniref:Uncharacterized protein n=1 Tax=Trichinella zimbabwensis TaxID=268475 RepID=A0A0V1HCM5_9BILA|nr:hypothetical protein T11_13111 [Trichinella zimbabwensis]